MSLQNLPSWNLSQYYTDYTDPKIQTDLTDIKTLVKNFENKYKTKMSSLTPLELKNAFEEVELLIVSINKPSYYLNLIYEAGGDNLELISKQQSVVDEQTTHLSNSLTFFDVELSKRSDLEVLQSASELVNYSYYLKVLADNTKYILSEEVEQVLSLKSLTGAEAWGKFFTDQKAKIEAELEIYGETKSYTLPALMDLMKSSDPKIRAVAFEAISSCFEENEENVLNAYNNILMDKKINDGLRGYQNAEESKLISNQISQSFVDSLVKTAENKINFIQDYYRLKNKILNITDPKWYDSYAGISFDGLPEIEYTWDECKNIIIETFTKFHPRFGAIATEAFDKNWLDAQLRTRKYGGAFMSNFAPQFHPVILCNYRGKMSDVSTVAHEMGHLIHSVLTDESQTLLNCNYTMSMAEIASLCCETVVFEKLYSSLTDSLEHKKLKLKMLCEKIEEESLNIYIGGVGRYNFESKIHKLFRDQGAISKEQIRKLWLEEHYTKVFGDVFSYPAGCQYTWQGVAHFTYIFYNYVYASGLLTSNAIYDVVKNNEIKKQIYIKEILSAGGSNSPANLLAKLDLDIESPTFWEIGFKLLENKLDEAKKLWAEIQIEQKQI